MHEATLGNWSQNSGVGRLIISLAFSCVCNLLGGRGGRLLTIYKYTSPLIPTQNECGNYS